MPAIQTLLSHRNTPLIVFLAVALLSLVVRQLLFRWVDKKTVHGTNLGYALLQAIRLPSIFWSLGIAIVIAIHTLSLTPKQLVWAHQSLAVFLIVSFTLVIASGSVRWISVYGQRNNMHFAVAGLSRTLTYVLVFSTGALALLRLFNISISPILAALGVGGVAVALALQDTLANLFAGIHILIEEPLLVGDVVKISSEEEGTVTDIGWRTTRLLTGTNNLIIVPNTKITSGILTNFSMPDKRLAVEIAIYVSHEADPHEVAQLAMESAAGVAGILAEPLPAVLFDPGLLPTHIQMKLVFFVGSRIGRGPIQSAVRTRMLEAFRAHGIPLPSTEKIVVMKG